MLNGKISDLSMLLQREELTEKDAALLASYSSELETARNAIASSSYNSDVNHFLRDELGSFSTAFARLCGVKLPETTVFRHTGVLHDQPCQAAVGPG